MHLTIVMYHYVRNIKSSKYPGIKGLEIGDFAKQIAHFKKSYYVISPSDLIDAIKNKCSIPPNALLVTFDDGYKDHLHNVLPILLDYKISGAFFPVAKCLVKRKVLDVNKIQFILASGLMGNNNIINQIFSAVASNQKKYNLKTKDEYWNRLNIPGRFDTAETKFIKYMLQRELPEDLRSSIVDDLFKQCVTEDEGAFSEELYMDAKDISYLHDNNQYIGSHGYSHYWLNSVSEKVQKEEIDKSLEFLKLIGVANEDQIMCYPYGGYNDSLLLILQQRNFLLGFSDQSRVVNLEIDNPLTLPRLDAKDFSNIRLM